MLNKYIKDITNQKFNYLTAIKFLYVNEKRNSVWIFRCECGKEITATGYVIKYGGRKSCGCKRRLPNNQAAINRSMENYISRAKKKGREFSLTKDQFVEITQKNCEYCEVPPVHNTKSRTGNYPHNGLDRKINDQGYTYENSLPCCYICNSIKGEYLSYEQMKALMRFVLKDQTDPWKKFRRAKGWT